MRLEKKLDILGPMDQARRCLDIWLKEEGRTLSQRQKKRVAALMARYFLYEDEVTDQLMLSFLRHYSGKDVVDMEDPTSVRMEIKAVLDKSTEQADFRPNRAVLVAVFAAVLLTGWSVTHRKITREEQAELKNLVHQIDAVDTEKTAAAIWNGIKKPLGVRRYDDMTWWDYWRSKNALAEQLRGLKKN